MENKNIAKKNNKLFQKYGEWAVITGASDGIGKEFAKSLSKLGFNLVLIARRKEKLEELAKSITNEYQTQCLVIASDLNILSSIDHILELTKDEKVGLLVASAGFGTSGQFLKSNLQSEIEMINFNCIALMNFSYHFGKKFAQQKR